MISFRYRAWDRGGREIRGRVRASSRAEAVQRVAAQGHQVFSLRPELPGLGHWFGSARRVGRPQFQWRRQIWVFTRELSALLRAGLPLAQALEAVIREQQPGPFRQVLEECRDQVTAGKSFAQALESAPRWFPPLYTNLVRAGETAGALEQVLDRLADDLSRSERLRGRVTNALLYPCFLLITGTVAVTFLLVRVVPSILAILNDLGQGVPLPTRVLMGLSGAVRLFLPIVAAGALVLAATSRMVLRQPAHRRQWDRFRLRLPGLGSLLQAGALSRFCRALASLLQAGVPLLKALPIAAAMLSNSALAGAVERVEEEVERGQPLGDSMERTGLFPSTLVYLTRAGELSGQLPRLLDEAAVIYEDQLERRSDRLISLLEPTLVLILGGLVLLIVLAVLVPIFEMNQMVGG